MIQEKAGSPGRTRTYNLAVNSRYKKVRFKSCLAIRRDLLFEKRNVFVALKGSLKDYVYSLLDMSKILYL